jgi:nucleotide-binding universal stress UspA family protein
MLEDNGIAARRIHQKIVKCNSIAETILREAREGEYGVLATGRTGRGETRTMHLLGSVSMNLLKHLESATLWISH